MAFFKKQRYVTLKDGAVLPQTKEQLLIKCERCGEIGLTKELTRHFKVCPRCGYHFRLTAVERLAVTLDEGSFHEFDGEMPAVDPFGCPEYAARLAAVRQATGLAEAVVTGEGLIAGHRVVVGVMDAGFMMASMGVVVGEKITRAIERATEKALPLIIFCASGGARMQEGVVALLQMAKTTAALARFAGAGLLYVAVLTDPTTGGVSASFALLGDIILAEPGALVGFAGPRVIEQTIRQKLPEGFQRAEFMRQHGFVDLVVPRAQLRATLSQILSLHQGG